jgi:hypothetical protein
MLAYVFWHRPKADADRDAYEVAQRTFHETIAVPSGCFRLDALPFDPGGGYEDWYLVKDWVELGVLNDVATTPARRDGHDTAAELAADGWGGVYALVRGPAEIPAGVEWRDKERGRPSADFLDSLPSGAVWRRQLVLGPASEFCLATPETEGRTAIWPI